MDSNIQLLLQPGKLLDGRYRIEGLIGVGGYAQVYQAVQVRNNQLVALKVLDVSKDPQHAEQLRQRFIREAQLAAQLSHSAIVATYDHGISEHGLPYMVLELLDGRNLTDTLRKVGPFQLTRAVGLMAACLDGLALAHDMGIVHRDLKPGNIFVRAPIEDPPRLCILDFGMAFLHNAQSRRNTLRGLLYGTPNYMAPEYLQKGIVTPALDVYQMGLVLVEMVRGRPAIDDMNPTTCFARHQKGELDIPQAMWDSPIGSALKKALRVNHARRFQHAGEFRDALRASFSALAQSGPSVPLSRPASQPSAKAKTELQPSFELPSGERAVRVHPIEEIRKRFAAMKAEADAKKGQQEGGEQEGRWDVEVHLPGSDDPNSLRTLESTQAPTIRTHAQDLDDSDDW